MWPDRLPDSLTRLVTPRAIRVYAEGLGWQRVEGVNGKIAVYKNPDSPLRQLIVPLDEQLSTSPATAVSLTLRSMSLQLVPSTKATLNVASSFLAFW
jgi:hypothetical protein